MSDSKRQQIIEALDTRLKTILTAGGYKSNIGQHVFEWKTTPFAEEELPGITYRDITSNRGAEGPVNKFRWAMNIELDIVAQATPGTMRDMINDVLKAIGTGPTWGGLAQGTRQPEVEIQVEQENKIITGAAMKFEIVYDAPLWDD
jgi:hypothetical protein